MEAGEKRFSIPIWIILNNLHPSGSRCLAGSIGANGLSVEMHSQSGLLTGSEYKRNGEPRD